NNDPSKLVPIVVINAIAYYYYLILVKLINFILLFIYEKKLFDHKICLVFI
ncbi:hypothetical protein MKX03_024276, partial [Papaver bracteatum]